MPLLSSGSWAWLLFGLMILILTDLHNGWGVTLALLSGASLVLG
jgi:hypothetical protein